MCLISFVTEQYQTELLSLAAGDIKLDRTEDYPWDKCCAAEVVSGGVMSAHV